jgi:hypothetical protein
MSCELAHPNIDELSVWQTKQYTLRNDQVDALIKEIQPGEAKRVFDAVCSNNLQNIIGLPQLMVLAMKSSAVLHPLLVRRQRVEFDPATERQRQQFISEIKTLKTLLLKSGIADIDSIPQNTGQVHLLALGVFANQALHQIMELEVDSEISIPAPGFGKGEADLYGFGLERVVEQLALNEQPITNTAAVLDTAVFLMQISGQLSSYEITRNRNVAKLMLGSLNRQGFEFEDLKQTNIGVMEGLGIGGVLRDFEHWAGKKCPPTPAEILPRLAKWQSSTTSFLSSTSIIPELQIAQLAADYNEIHPWREGNGRSLVVEVNKLRTRVGLNPIYIPPSENSSYVFALGNPASEKDSQKLAEFYGAHTMPLEEFSRTMQGIISD